MTLIGIGIGIGFNSRSTATSVIYPPPPWTDALTDANTLGWTQFGSETNVGIFSPTGFALTVQSGNDAVLIPFGAINQHAAAISVDAAVKGTITPGVGATGTLQAVRIDSSTNGYIAQLVVSASAVSIEAYRLDAGVGTLLAIRELDTSVAWGGVWLKTETSSADTRLRAYALHSDGTWRLLIDEIDLDATDNDTPGWPAIGLRSMGGDTAFALTLYEGTTDAGKVYNESVLMESNFTGSAGPINGRYPDTTGTNTFNVTAGSVSYDGSGKLVPAATGQNVAVYDVGIAYRVEGNVQLSSNNDQDRIGLQIASYDANNYWLAFYNRLNSSNKFTIIERAAGTSIVRAGSGSEAALGSGVFPMAIEITSDDTNISATFDAYTPLSYTPGGTITRYGTNAGVQLSPNTAPTGITGLHNIKVTP